MCNAVFNTKWYFMNHVRENHIELKEICSHFQTGRCKFSEDDCWGRHLVSTSNNSFECHSCKEIFSTKNMMMKHWKLTHRTKQCNEMLKELVSMVMKNVGICISSRIFTKPTWHRHQSNY